MQFLDLALVAFVAAVSFVAAVTAVTMRDGGRARRAAQRIRENWATARWRLDDTGTTAEGACEMAIELVAPGVASPLGRRVVGTYDPGDNAAWMELTGQASAMADELNTRIEAAQARRGKP